MHGPNVEPGTHVSRVAGLYPEEDLLTGPGIVDYVVGAEPGPGVFVIGTHDDEIQREYLKLFKLGDGPLYTFYTPYHLCHMEIQNAVARAVLFQDATIAPLGPPRVEVITTAKRNLKAGEVLDGIGYYMTYGQVENADVTYRERLLPMGLAEGCRLTRDVPCDAVISYSDVTVPEGRFADRLREEQDAYFFGGTGRFVSAGNE
jgi:predicted homoserine dehydrogenase-like protein